MSSPAVYAILLAGGSGTRFWPASRKARPKQFLRMAGERTLLAETAARVEGLVPVENVIVVTTAELVAQVRAAAPQIRPENVLAEPAPKNTGPAIALAAIEVRRRDPSALQVVLPADHVIRPREAFQRTLRAALEVAADGATLLVFGIRPSHAATAFGWIQAGAAEREIDGLALRAVQRFTEKPDARRAQSFFEQASYFWNSGMFVWSTAAICTALERHLPEAWAALSPRPTGAALARAYSPLTPLSIDVGVIERARDVRMLPIDYFWSDVGSWDALATVHEADAHGNVVAGGVELAALDAHGCIVHGDAGALTALIGVRDLVVVQAANITLVCARERAQDVKALVERLSRARPDVL